MPIQPFQIAPAPVEQSSVSSPPTLTGTQGTFFVQVVNGNAEAFFTNGAGNVVQITSNGEVITTTMFEKNMVNNSGSTIASGTPVCVNPADGSILPANAAQVADQDPVGITMASIAASATGKVALFGRNMPGLVTGLGFLPGDEIFVGPSSGVLTNDEAALANNSDAVVYVGIAVCADGATGSAATDLIMYKEIDSLQS